MDSALGTLDVETFNSQELMEYLNEYRYVSLDGDSPTDDDNPPEEGEEEAEWLRQVGFESLVSALEPSSGAADTPEWQGLVTLSHRQAAVVKRRLHALHNTLQKRRTRQRSRRPDMRRLFPCEPADSASTHSRSGTPDSLDSLTPPRTPPEADSRLDAGSPHSQGYHSSSRGSLDRLEAAEHELERAAEYRHVLRIPLEADWRRGEADGRDSRQGEAGGRDWRQGEAGGRDWRQGEAGGRDSRQGEAGGRDWRQGEADGRDRGPARTRRLSHDVADNRGPPTLAIFESSGNYDLTRPLPSPSESSGIEAVSFHPIGSVRRRSEAPIPTGLDRRLAPQGRSRSKPDVGLSVTGTPSPSGVGTAQGTSAEERLGRTRLGDLSESDVTRVQKLALIELTGLLDEHGLSYSRWKARRRRLGARSSTDGGVFGTSLTSLLKRDRHRQPESTRGAVPLAFEKLLSHLEHHGVREEGLLRVPGHRHKIQQLRQLMDERFYSQPASVDAALQCSSVADVAALLKQLLRQLPEPLLTDASLDAFQLTDALPPGEEQVQALSLLCLRLPAANRALLRRLLAFLATITAHERTNKMSLENVAMIMAPNLMPARRRRQDIAAEIAFASVTSRVVRRLVVHRHQLWSVPAQFVRQVRHQHEEEMYERARREAGGPMKLLLKRRDTAIVRKIDNEVDFQEGVIRVCAAQFGRVSWPIRLGVDTTAGAVVTSCIREAVLCSGTQTPGRRHRRDSPPDGGTVACQITHTHLTSVLHTHFLHEHGGNIGERRLEHRAIMLDCYQENPNARWVLHCCHDPTPTSGGPGAAAVPTSAATPTNGQSGTHT